MIDYNDGAVILIDKPQNWTSFDVVNKLRYVLKIKKIGHAGTLDPLATGLLILCTGKWTKKIDEFQAKEKEYITEITFGKTTPSYDSETEPDAEFGYNHITNDMIYANVSQFIGTITQKPPMYSAIKINGKRLYELARKGKKIDVPDRQVEIKYFEIIEINLPKITCKIICSKGTYIRSLAHDFAKSLQSGGFMSALRRTRIGDFDVKDAKDIQNYITEFNQNKE